MKPRTPVLVDTLSYQQAVADLEEQLQDVADYAHDFLVRHGDGDEDRMHCEMQKVYRALDKARARGMAAIDRVFSMVETGAVH